MTETERNAKRRRQRKRQKIVNRFNREEKSDVTLPWEQKFWMTTMKSLSKDDGENNENGKKAIGLAK